jgi:hypothetical protein
MGAQLTAAAARALAACSVDAYCRGSTISNGRMLSEIRMRKWYEQRGPSPFESWGMRLEMWWLGAQEQASCGGSAVDGRGAGVALPPGRIDAPARHHIRGKGDL